MKVTEYPRDMGYPNSKDMGYALLREEVEPMPWRGVAMSEQSERFVEG